MCTGNAWSGQKLISLTDTEKTPQKNSLQTKWKIDEWLFIRPQNTTASKYFEEIQLPMPFQEALNSPSYSVSVSHLPQAGCAWLHSAQHFSALLDIEIAQWVGHLPPVPSTEQYRVPADQEPGISLTILISWMTRQHQLLLRVSEDPGHLSATYMRSLV